MAKIERNHKSLLVVVATAKARIKEIERIFSLMALVRQQIHDITMENLKKCMAAVGVESLGGGTVIDIFRSTGSTLRGKIDVMHPLLENEHRQLRKNLQNVQRNARALQKSAREYVYRPGKTEAELKKSHSTESIIIDGGDNKKRSEHKTPQRINVRHVVRAKAVR